MRTGVARQSADAIVRRTRPRREPPVPDPMVVVLAGSAGGIPAITSVLAALPPTFAAAVLVVQHLDPRHRSRFSEILDRACALPVAQARDGERVLPGRVRVAPPDWHLLIRGGGRLQLSQAPLVNFVRPSADVLLESAAMRCGERVVAVVLSGTGVDGRQGALAVKRAGGTVIAQDEATSAFFGMPGATIDAGAVDLVLPLERIAPALMALVARLTARSA